MLRLFFAVCMLIFLGNNLSGQISINSVNYNTVSLNESNMLQAVIANTGGNTQATALVSVKNASGELILEAKSKVFTLNTGINSVNGISVGFSSLVYGSNSKALYLKNNGLFSSGNYSYCLKVVPYGNVETGDIYCEEFETAIDDFLSLVMPYDGDTIETSYPLLTWTHSEPFNTLAKNEYFKIVVTEIKKDQSAEQAIFANTAIYSKTFLTTHSINYPVDAKELEKGKHYAWQVQKISNNIIINKTDVWEFSISKKITKEPYKYALLRNDAPGGTYICTDDALYFRFDEEYTSTKLRYEIRNNKNEVIETKIKNESDSKQKEIMQNSGVNRYELKLDGYGLKEGYYTLVVYNAKEEKFYLRFYVSK